MYLIFAMDSVNHSENKNDTNVTQNEFDLEAILSDLGAFGKFQIFIYSLTILPILLISCLGLSYIFTAGQLEYRYCFCIFIFVLSCTSNICNFGVSVNQSSGFYILSFFGFSLLSIQRLHHSLI